MNRNPPKPRFALAVGIIGHRPDRLPEDVRDKVAADVSSVLEGLSSGAEIALGEYKELFSSVEPLLTVITALAEGADRIAADAAVARGWVLDAVLPFPTSVYQADFSTPQSNSAFQTFLSRSRSVLVLPGQRQDEVKAYKSAGLTVLDQSDILLAIWDHGPSGGSGGTTDMVEAAVRLDIPIVHVDARGKIPPCIRWSQLSKFPAPVDAIDDLPVNNLQDGLKVLVEKLVQPPHADSERRSLKRYLGERFPGYSFRLEFPILMAVCGVRAMRKSDWRPLSPLVRARELVKPRGALSDEKGRQEPSVLTKAYGWADAIGIRFAQAFRSAFVINFLFASVAVVVAVTSLLFSHDKKYLFVSAELLLIGIVLLNTVIGRWRSWHRRWFEPREIAERLRVAYALWVLGARPRSFAGQEPAWTGWYARAIFREQSFFSGSLDDPDLGAARNVLIELLHHQCNYHQNSALLMTKLEGRLETFGLILFGATILTALTFLSLVPFWEVVDTEAVLVTALASSLPALATATYGIRVIGDFEGIARRSERTHEALKDLIKAVNEDPLMLDRLRARARSAAEAMLGDVSSWRVAAESRSLNIPG